MIRENCNEIKFDLVDIFEEKALFTPSRCQRDSLPEGLFLYETREAEAFNGIPIELEVSVFVNFCGTIIAKTPLLKSHERAKHINEEDFGYSGEELTLKEFVEKCRKEDV